MEQQQGRQEQDEQHDPRRHAWVPAQRAERRAALVARIRAANAETLFLDYNHQPYTDPHPDDAVAFVLRLAQGGYAGQLPGAVADFRSMLGAPAAVPGGREG
ncbi:hypothetical protein ACFYS8_15900 [Kitasatospora sp. NPDC004615]|uniref:hypothetical protein n=1 Tax=Kitasatospora sp. NPDC004615 TaxID=3364017 RepID=UPI00369551C2